MATLVLPQMRGHQAITTRYIGPTNTKAARIKATAEAGSTTVAWDHALNIQDNHAAAAITLAQIYGWDGELCQGGIAGGYCFVFVDRY